MSSNALESSDSDEDYYIVCDGKITLYADAFGMIMEDLDDYFKIGEICKREDVFKFCDAWEDFINSKEKETSRYKLVFSVLEEDEDENEFEFVELKEINVGKELSEECIIKIIKKIFNRGYDGYSIRSELFNLVYNYNISSFSKRDSSSVKEEEDKDKEDRIERSLDKKYIEEFIIAMIVRMGEDFWKTKRDDLFDFLHEYIKEM